jgi:hypothetical protein
VLQASAHDRDAGNRLSDGGGAGLVMHVQVAALDASEEDEANEHRRGQDRKLGREDLAGELAHAEPHSAHGRAIVTASPDAGQAACRALNEQKSVERGEDGNPSKARRDLHLVLTVGTHNASVD